VKLLFDENLSARLVELFASEFPGSVHVEYVLGSGRSDAEVWSSPARTATPSLRKDNDFRQRAFLSGPPPKVVWLAVGNADTATIAELLRSRTAELAQLDAESATALLVLGL